MLALLLCLSLTPPDPIEITKLPYFLSHFEKKELKPIYELRNGRSPTRLPPGFIFPENGSVEDIKSALRKLNQYDQEPSSPAAINYKYREYRTKNGAKIIEMFK